MNEFNPNMICPLCGIRTVQHNGKKYVSREHIPPQCIFIRDRIDLITVPSCKECNYGTSPSDQKFKALLGMYFGYEEPVLWYEAVKTLNKNIQHKNKLLEDMQPVLLPFADGQPYQKLKVSDEDKDVLKNAVIKIVKGLHWHITKKIVSADCKIVVNFIKQGKDADAHIQDILNESGKWLPRKGKVFQVQYYIGKNEPLISLWRLRFYSKDLFLAGVMPI